MGKWSKSMIFRLYQCRTIYVLGIYLVSKIKLFNNTA